MFVICLYLSLPAVSQMPTLNVLSFECIVFAQNAAPTVWNTNKCKIGYQLCNAMPPISFNQPFKTLPDQT